MKNNIDITVNVQHKFNKKLSANLHISNLFDKENNISKDFNFIK